MFSLRGSPSSKETISVLQATSRSGLGTASCSALRDSSSISLQCTRNISSSSSTHPFISPSKSRSQSRPIGQIDKRGKEVSDYQHTFHKSFHTSSSSSAQLLPDDDHLWNYHPPEQWSQSSSSTSTPITRQNQVQQRWPSKKGKGKETSSHPHYESNYDPFQSSSTNVSNPKSNLRKDINGSELDQGHLDISQEAIDDLFKSSLQADEIPLQFTEDEILGIIEGMQESEMLGGTEQEQGQDEQWDLPEEIYQELDLGQPHSEIHRDIDPSRSSPSSASRTSKSQLSSLPTPRGDIAPVPHVDTRLLPSLPTPIYPSDVDTRYDWRTRALSQMKKKSRRNWFGQLPKRKEPTWTKLQMGEWGREELDRYSRHFIPLLEAEQGEEERLFNSRISEWTFDRLRREGYALDELRGSSNVYQPKSLMGLGTVYGFVRGKGDRELPFNRFTIGSNIVISRTDPQVDAVTAIPADPKTRIIGSVWNSTKGHLRIMFPQEIDDINSGTWRLDLACSDFAIKKQIEAIKSLNLDPFEIDQKDFPRMIPTTSIQPISATSDAGRRQGDEEQEAIRTVLSQSSGPMEKARYQTILRGTTLRDLLFRAFQEDYTPLDKSVTFVNVARTGPDHLVHTPNEIHPSDLDAIPIPDPRRTPLNSVLSKNQLIQSWTERYRVPGKPIHVEGDPDVGLNSTQMRAIAMMLGERLSLVQGPPGTGKTRVIIETIKLLKKHWQIPQPILVTAHTNVAVDNLLSGLRAHGLKALRFGAINRIPEEFGDWTLDRMIGQHPRWWDLEQARKEKDLLTEKKFKGDWSAEDDARLMKVGQKIWVIRQSIMRDVLLDADVICTTCLSATSKALQGIDFPIVFLDEASMATETLSLVPLTKGSSHVAIIGDHKQLPPVIVSPEAHAGGLATSLFERLIHEGHIPSIMLDTQYRMHPSLSSFPSDTFYSSLLKNGTPPSDRLAPETEFLVTDESGVRQNITFLNHDHPESPMSKSLANYGDAEYVCDAIADLLFKNPELRGSQIGIITPYLSQLRLITNHLSGSERRAAFVDLLGAERTKELDDIEIKTVDGFEGREKEVIIFSSVRCNNGGWIGFLGDWRRVNVALTRARRALIMIGSKKTLSNARIGKTGEETLPSGGAKVWRDLIDWLENKGVIMDAE
ncbi:uncharacterized protein IL334_003546 [Kwoniella shivajii]|uniref:DNA helicase n=1 Tax=Kwoniella shivajii TaxID=564305 RepID=A0ABZ1CZ19_9TREE|nr:hypothetical protein IL334_003546 [Kwoniella shivajii]